MNLQPVCSTPHVTASFDSWNNWLYLEWEGELTLPAAQQACLAIARSFLTHTYPRVLSNSGSLGGVSREVVPWMAQWFLPYLSLAGVEQLAWVHSRQARSRSLAEHSSSPQGSELRMTFFADVEDAVSWLQQTTPEYVSGCAWMPRPTARREQLQRAVSALEQALAASQGAAPR